MGIKTFLIVMTIIAVISDSMLHPFYPQYFAQVFGVHDSSQVGSYIAACSITVMLAFPVWARIAKRIPVLNLLIITQIMTGLLSLWSAVITNLWAFWAVSLAGMVFKASYLLIYPYVMSLESKSHHINTIGLLAFMVYFGNIIAALLSGLVFETVDPRFLFVLMAGGDLLQILLCLYMQRSGQWPKDEEAEAENAEAPMLPRGFVLRLGLIMLIMYFSAYVTEPFFASYFEQTIGSENRILSGTVYAIPGIAALVALFVNSRVGERAHPYAGIAPAIVLGIVGLLLQTSSSIPLLLIGRFIYGWALFQSMVRLDLLLFQLSTPESYATDFSKLNLFQALGVQAASFTAAALVTHGGLKVPFLGAAAGFSAAVLLFLYVFREKFHDRTSAASDLG